MVKEKNKENTIERYSIRNLSTQTIHPVLSVVNQRDLTVTYLTRIQINLKEQLRLVLKYTTNYHIFEMVSFCTPVSSYCIYNIINQSCNKTKFNGTSYCLPYRFTCLFPLLLSSYDWLFVWGQLYRWWSNGLSKENSCTKYNELSFCLFSSNTTIPRVCSQESCKSGHINASGHSIFVPLKIYEMLSFFL